MKHQDLISKMTLEEKASLCSGKDFWHLKGLEKFNIPEIMVCDGPHGLRKQTGSQDNLGINGSEPATCFPTAATTACSWNPELLHERLLPKLFLLPVPELYPRILRQKSERPSSFYPRHGLW